MDDALMISGVSLVLAALSFYVAGPFGMLVLGIILISIGIAGPSSAETRRDRINCAECGAVNPRDSDACSYCDSPFDGTRSGGGGGR